MSDRKIAMSNLLFVIRFRGNVMATILLLLCLTIGLACETPKSEGNGRIVAAPVGEQSPDDAATKLDKFYMSKDCKGFVGAFPETFQAFDQLYGYNDQTGERPLYSKYAQHVPYFFSCDGVSDVDRLNKAIKLGVGGKWDADAVGMLQDSTYSLVTKHPKEAEDILDGLPDDTASSFWYFLMDAPHPSDPQRLDQFQKLSALLGKQTKQSKLLIAQHQKLLTEGKEDRKSGVIRK